MKKKVFLSQQQRRKLAREYANGTYSTLREAGAAYNISSSAAGRIVTGPHAPENGGDIASQIAALSEKMTELNDMAEPLGFTVKLERLS